MFTGIIEEIGTIKSIAPQLLSITATKIVEDTKPGDSIAVNGICLTVKNIRKGSFDVDLMPETLKRSSLNYLHYGDKLNLERAMPANGRFGGHFVEGHIDDTGRVEAVIPESEAVIMRISLKPELNKYIVEKGFIAVDGVSLTIVECQRYSFSVSMVNFTRQHTTLGFIRPGQYVNIEVDIISKYLEKFNRKPGKDAIDFLVGDDLTRSRWN